MELDFFGGHVRAPRAVPISSSSCTGTTSFILIIIQSA